MIALDIPRLGLALGLIVAAIAIVRSQRLGLEWMLLVATVRTILQLFAVGYLLAVVFAWRTPWGVLAVLLVMVGVATVVARNRISQQMRQLLPLIAGVLLTSTTLTIVYTIGLVIRPAVWYEPQYVIPLAGIVLGNAMTAASIAGDRLVSTCKQHQVEIETHLSLGATPSQAIVAYRLAAIKAGMIPTLNAMMVVGIVKLPGIITGQLLSNQNPLDASLYQMLIMFMLAFSDLLAVVLVTAGLRRHLFNAAAQLTLP